MSYEILLTEVPAQKVIAITTETSLSTIGETMGKSYGELYRHIAMRGLAPQGPPTAVYSNMKAGKTVTVEVCVPVKNPVAGEGITIDELPAAAALTTLHRGPYEELPRAYEAVEDYARSHGLELAGPMREQYLNGPPESRPEEYETLIQWPVERAA